TALRGGRVSARRGKPVVGHRASGIAISPGVAMVWLGSGWRNADYADLHADGRRWVRIPDRCVGSGGYREGSLWVPRAEVLPSPWPPHSTRRFSAVPPLRNTEWGPGGEANARASGLPPPAQFQGPHRTA